MRLARSLLLLLRVLAGVQVLLGVAFWTGHWYGLVNVHRTTGVVFVLVLWAIAILALAGRRAPALAAGALVWGVVIAGVGFSQQRILPGDLHWIVRVAHLIIGLAAMPVAERLSRAPEGRVGEATAPRARAMSA